jgi:hypothetical protein
MRYTSLDRLLQGGSVSREQDSGGATRFEVDLTKQRDNVRQHNLRARLMFLRSMGLSETITPQRWTVRSDFETVLRAVQRAADRQRTLAAHHSLLSDSRLQSCVTDVSKIDQLEGRVLGHSEDEANGKAYMLLEGTDHNVHFVYHSPEIDRCRHSGELQPNSFIRIIRREDRNLVIQDFGDADRLLGNKEYFQRKAQSLIRRGILPSESSLDGWLGKYESAIRHAITDVTNGSLGVDSREIIPRQRGR